MIAELIEDDRSYSSLDAHNEFDLYLANKAAEWLDTNDKSELPIIPVKQKMKKASIIIRTKNEEKWITSLSLILIKIMQILKSSLLIIAPMTKQLRKQRSGT